MDYIFNDWEKKLSNFADSVEKDLNEIRQCKAEIQQMKLEMEVERQKGRYVRDDHKLVLSAPEIVIGNVDRNGTLFPGGSTIVVRGTDVGVQAAGEGGLLEMRAAGIRQIAEDPGVDGYEHVVYNRSEVVSQARNIIIQSDETTDAFFAPTIPTGGSGVRIHADQKVDIEAAMTAESREELLSDMTKSAENMQKLLKAQADQQKSGLQSSIEEITKLIKKKEKLAEDYTAVRTNAADIQSLDRQIRELSSSIANNIYDYTEVLSQLAEANRQAKSFKALKEAVVKGKDFKTKPTGAAVAITGEHISLVSADGEGNLLNPIRLDGFMSTDEESIGKQLQKIAKEKDTKGEYRRVGEIHGFPILMCSEPLDKDGLGMFQNKFCVEGNYKYRYNNGFIALADPIAAARNFINSLERIPQTIEQYKEKNAVLAKDIPLLKEIVGKQWKKEDELKGLKSELAALDRKIQLELAKDKEPTQQVANGTDGIESSQVKEAPSKEAKSSGLHI